MKLREWILQLLFPPRCPVCGEIVPIGERCSCAAGLDALELGLTEIYAENERRSLDFVDSAVACYRYADGAREIVHQYKFGERPALVREMADHMAALADEIYADAEPDAVVCVPSYKNESNHGYRLAAKLAGRLGLPFWETALVKTRRTGKQHELGAAERAVNLRDVFAARKDEVSGKRLLLCDDVITSGATMNECAKALKAAGASYVFGIAFAATVYRQTP